MSPSVFIIAEAGVNHNGNLDLALKMVETAVEIGADAIKFQTFIPERLVTSIAEKAHYQKHVTSCKETQLEMLKKLTLCRDEFILLSSYCADRGILFLSTPFDEESVDVLDDMDMPIFKIPSGEITNRRLIQHIASKQKPIILSTGMSYLGEIEKAISWIEAIQATMTLTLLHCTSDYPVPVADVNLNVMRTLKTAFRLPVGYSDHTTGIDISIAAAALGACILEKHFTLDCNMQGPDHRASIEPEQFKAMVNAIRNVEKALGDGQKKPTQQENNTRKIIRKSVVARKRINPGDIITAEDIDLKRPGTGISPEFNDIVINMQARHTIEPDSVIHWEDLKHT